MNLQTFMTAHTTFFKRVVLASPNPANKDAKRLGHEIETEVQMRCQRLPQAQVPRPPCRVLEAIALHD